MNYNFGYFFQNNFTETLDLGYFILLSYYNVDLMQANMKLVVIDAKIIKIIII